MPKSTRLKYLQKGDIDNAGMYKILFNHHSRKQRVHQYQLSMPKDVIKA